MTEYKLEIKQIVDYPKCRIYRQFIQSLIADRSIRTNGCSGLFHYVVLCCYANFRTSYQRYDGISYIVHPGQWICPLWELRTWFRARTNRQLLRQLDFFQRHHFIEYDLIGRGQLVQYRILDWPRYNTVLDYSCPCQKDSGFFFLPMSAASRLLSLGKCSEMDTLLDLWLNAIYNDHQVAGSEAGPVVYLRNGRQPARFLCRTWQALGRVQGDGWAYPQQIRTAGIHQDIFILRPQRNGNLSSELSVHHVPDFRCHGGQRRSRNGAESLHPRTGLCAGYGAAGLRIRLLDQRFKIAHGDSDCRSPEALENTGHLLHDLPPVST